MVQTSYFANIKNLPKDVKLLSIARGTPQWYKGEKYEKLFPSWELIKNTETPEPYTEIYHEQVLTHLNPAQVLEEIGENTILLCWEKPGDFCHRRIVAAWLEQNLGINVPEFETEVFLTRKKNQQISLF